MFLKSLQYHEGNAYNTKWGKVGYIIIHTIITISVQKKPRNILGGIKAKSH